MIFLGAQHLQFQICACVGVRQENDRSPIEYVRVISNVLRLLDNLEIYIPLFGLWMILVLFSSLEI